MLSIKSHKFENKNSPYNLPKWKIIKYKYTREKLFAINTYSTTKHTNSQIQKEKKKDYWAIDDTIIKKMFAQNNL